jgi:D-3-phosphoglycerate dehydrogenase
MTATYFIIDFDSTIVQVEALDELAKIALENNPHKQEIVTQIQEITNLGMEGKITFPESLARRLQLFSPNRNHIDQLIELLKEKLTDSVKRNQQFFREKSDYLYIISGGFKEYIIPVVQELGIAPEKVLANTFIFSKDTVIGFDPTNHLAQENGKVKQVQSLNLNGNIIVLGDGFTDYQIKEAHAANTFYAFTENISRTNVIEKADHVVNTIDEFLYTYALPPKKEDTQ